MFAIFICVSLGLDEFEWGAVPGLLFILTAMWIIQRGEKVQPSLA